MSAIALVCREKTEPTKRMPLQYCRLCCVLRATGKFCVRWKFCASRSVCRLTSDMSAFSATRQIEMLLPPSASLSRCVSFASAYGAASGSSPESVSATVRRLSTLLLSVGPSFMRSVVGSSTSLSVPATSTKMNRLRTVCRFLGSPDGSSVACVRSSWNTALAWREAGPKSLIALVRLSLPSA